MTLAKLAAVFPVELLLHAVVLHYHLSFLLSVAVLTVTTSVFVIWVVEPSALRILRRWLHAPAHRRRHEVLVAPALWRIRTIVDDEPGSLERLAHGLAMHDVSILGFHIHPLERGALDEIVVAASDDITSTDLVAAVTAGGGTDAHVWPTSPLALVDGQTSALTFAARVAADPSELPLAVAEMLNAHIVTDRVRALDPRRQNPEGQATLTIPSPWSGLFVFSRADQPFTPAESARAHRLAEVAEAAVTARLRSHVLSGESHRPEASSHG